MSLFLWVLFTDFHLPQKSVMLKPFIIHFHVKWAVSWFRFGTDGVCSLEHSRFVRVRHRRQSQQPAIVVNGHVIIGPFKQYTQHTYLYTFQMVGTYTTFKYIIHI